MSFQNFDPLGIKQQHVISISKRLLINVGVMNLTKIYLAGSGSRWDSRAVLDDGAGASEVRPCCGSWIMQKVAAMLEVAASWPPLKESNPRCVLPEPRPLLPVDTADGSFVDLLDSSHGNEGTAAAIKINDHIL